MKETPSQKNLFTGSLDLDNEARSVKDNDYVDALNIRNSVSRDGKDKQVTKMRGNELIPFVQPQTPIPSTNKCIGAFENLATRLNYSFIYNDQGAMQIRENNIDNGVITNLVQYNFGWQPDKFISNIDLVDNKLLLWTDIKPKRINISKSREDKQFKGNIYFISPNDPFTPPNTAFTFSILDKNNIVIDNGQAIASYVSGGIPFSRKLTADALAFFITNNVNLNPLGAGTFCTATACQEYIEIEFTQQGYFQFSVSATQGVDAIYVPQNYYFSITDTIIDAGKYPLNCPPRLQIKQDNKRVGFNNIERTTWQFATQVIYDDFDESTLSPYSDIAFINCEQRGNYIEVDFTDLRLNNPTDLSIISKVKILGRPNNQGKFREIATIEQSELWANSGVINSNTFRFYNDGQYTIIDDATSTLPYSALPIEIVGDKYDMGEENFDNRVGYSKFIENYEAPCISAELAPSFTENDEFVCTVFGQVLILNTEQFQKSPNATGARGWHRNTLNDPSFNFGLIGVIHQTQNDLYPVFGGARTSNVLTDISTTSEQILPEGGFPIYFAGTNYLAISKQEQTLTNVNYNPSGAINTSTATLINELRDWYVDYNNNPNGRGNPKSSWKIQGVKAGTYVIRVASHLCSFNDVLAKGNRYDLYNNNLYQTTSTYLKGINVWNPNTSDFFTFEDSFEVVLEINSNRTYSVYRNNQILINSQPIVNGELFLGQMWIEDMSLLRTDFNGGLKFYAGSSFSGYLIDADASLNANAVKFGIAMERQKVTLIADIAPDPLNPMTIGNRFEQIRTTDHNGFIYGSYFQSILDGAISYRFTSESVTGGTNASLVSRNVLTEYYYNDVSIYSAIDSSSASFGFILDSNLPTILYDRKHRQLFLPNINQQVTLNARTLLKGRVINSNGQGVSGVTIIYARTGRVEKTQLDGTYSIIAYGAFNETNSRTDLFILSSCCDCVYNFSLTNQTYWYNTVQITPFGTTYTNVFPFDIADIIANLLSISIGRKLKAGGRYNFALFHVDDLNRRHALVTNNLEVAIPFLTEQRQSYFQGLGTGNSNGIFEFTLNVTSTPPAWADKLYVARTQDTYYSDFLQFPLYDALYVVQYDDENSIPIETTYSTFSANEIYLGFPQSTIAYKEFNSASQKGWDFQEGDRVRFISKPSGELYSELYDLPIKAQRTDSTNEFIYFAIDNLDALGEVTQGTLVEVYRPKKDLDDNVELFFEIHQCIDIVNGQYVGLPKKLSTGDTYSRNRTVPISNGLSSNFIEDNSISDNWASRQQDIGRVVVKDTRFGRLIRENAIKFSNQYIPGSKLNGLSRFEPLNEFEYPRQYGAINKLIMVNDNADVQVLLVACENNSFVIYIREVIYNDVRGTETVSVADRVLGSFRTLKGDYGTKNPESFAFRDGQLFWWDVNRGAFIRYDNNGVDDISSLNTLQYALSINSNTSVISAYDDFYSEFITIPLQEGKQAIGFLSDKRGWNGFYSFKPEMLGTSAEFILSWKDGNLYLHDSPNVPYCNFYGQQFDSRITFVSKLSPLGLKVAQNMRVKASQVWEALSIKTVPNAMYKQGMMSRLKRDNWKNFEGDFWATVLRNMNDPRFTDPNVALLRGEPMRGDAFIVELSNDSTELQSLRMAEMYYFSSENTNG
jgi:hypothetical protein